MKNLPSIKLRAPKRADAPAIDRLFRLPEIAEFTRLPETVAEGAGSRFIEYAMSKEAWPKCIVHIIETTEGEIAGIVVLEDDPLCMDHQGTRLVWYWIDPKFGGNGYASAAVDKVVSWAFGPPLRLEKIIACVLSGHLASIRVLEKVGFAEFRNCLSSSEKFSGCHKGKEIKLYEKKQFPAGDSG